MRALVVAVLAAVILTGCQSEADRELREDAERQAIWYCPVEPPSWADEHEEYERCIDDEADRLIEEGKVEQYGR